MSVATPRSPTPRFFVRPCIASDDHADRARAFVDIDRRHAQEIGFQTCDWIRTGEWPSATGPRRWADNLAG